jgi:opacity protein-like surface antigen
MHNGLGRAGVIAVLASVASMAAGQAAAEGWYGSLGAGVAAEAQTDIDTPAVIDGRLDVESDVTGLLAIGRVFFQEWRAELEVSRRGGDMEASLGLDQGGRVTATAAMFNVYHDWASGQRVSPYLGIGVGFAAARIRARNDAPLIPVSIDDEVTGFAYQAIAGVSLDVAPHMALDFGYRYFKVDGLSGHGVAPPLPRFPFDAEFSQQSVTAAARWRF